MRRDLTGETHGKCTVIDLHHAAEHCNSDLFNCVCSCGRRVRRTRSSLLSKNHAAMCDRCKRDLNAAKRSSFGTIHTRGTGRKVVLT